MISFKKPKVGPQVTIMTIYKYFLPEGVWYHKEGGGVIGLRRGGMFVEDFAVVQEELMCFLLRHRRGHSQYVGLIAF